jgi:thioredoxin reductase
MDNFAAHAEQSGSELLQDFVNEVEKTDAGFCVKTAS